MGSKRHGKPRKSIQLAGKFSSAYVAVQAALSTDHENNPFTFKNRQDAVSLTPNKYGDKRIVVPPTKPLTIMRAKGPDAVPRAVVVFKPSDKLLKCEQWHPFVIHEGTIHRVTIWWHGKQAVLVRERRLAPRTVERSIVYPGVETARLRYNQERVVWDRPVPVRDCPEFPNPLPAQ